MNDLIVVAGCTHREGFVNEYEQQLALAGIDFHLEPLASLSGGANSITMRWRIDFLRKMAHKFSDYKKIIATDAWDVLFYGEKEEVMNKIPDTLMLSAERNCYPEPGYAPHFTSSSPWKYANSMIASSPAYLIDWLEWAQQMPDIDILDQAWFNRRAAENQTTISLDETTDLFYVVSSTQEDGSLQIKHGLPWNRRYNTYPNFFHFSGHCPVDGFRNLLVNGGQLG